MVGLLVGVAALVLYVLTCAPGAEWQDCGIHQYRILVGQAENPLGLALSHPLHHYLGRLLVALPLGDPLYKLNLLSALSGAFGVGALAALLMLLTGRAVVAVAAAGSLALAFSYWQMSVVTETYTLAAALMVIEWLCLWQFVRTRQPGWLVAVFAVNGLHVADHLLGLLTLVTYGVLLLERIARSRVHPAWLLGCSIAWGVAALPYELLIVQHWLRDGDLFGTLSSALFGGSERTTGWAGSVLNTSLNGKQLALAVMTFGYCFPSATALVALRGVFLRMRGRRRSFRNVLLAQTVIICVFVMRYSIQDLYTYFVPVCALTAFWFGWGLHTLLRGRRSIGHYVTALLVVNALLPIAVYFAFPIVAERQGWLRGQLRDLPFRNEYHHFFRPWRHNDPSLEQFPKALLAATGPNGWALAGTTTAGTVASYALVHDPDAAARIYWGRDCLVPQDVPPLTDEELKVFIKTGGRVIGVPGPAVGWMVMPPFVRGDADPFWHVGYEAGSGVEED